RTSYDRRRKGQRGLNSSTTLTERVKTTVSKIDIVANKKSPTLRSLATESMRLVLTRKTFQKILPFEMFSCTHFIIF
ncbi:hypothetical protein RLH42_01190, partial [Streptococcus pneumoniae]|nr:hypothetical protein [Streptococcus pneumoniae]